MTLIETIKAKNRALSRFWQVTEAFRKEIEGGDWENLAGFHQERDYILKGIDELDRRSTLAAQALRQDEKTESLKEELRALLRERDHAIAEIFRLDAVVLRLIEEERDRTEAALGTSVRGRSIIGKFKSSKGGASGSGRELDGEV
ncbi:MAG: flagellar protein FliT [Bdellovibrionales bacterium]|nr:flagellar protein FliT [Bdellovibrionales bacterium]